MVHMPAQKRFITSQGYPIPNPFFHRHLQFQRIWTNTLDALDIEHGSYSIPDCTVLDEAQGMDMWLIREFVDTEVLKLCKSTSIITAQEEGNNKGKATLVEFERNLPLRICEHKVNGGSLT